MKDCSWYFFTSFTGIPQEFQSGKRFIASECITQGSYVDNCFQTLFIVSTIYTIYFLQNAELYYRHFHDTFFYARLCKPSNPHDLFIGCFFRQCVKIKTRWKYWSMCLITVQVDFRNFGFTVFNIVF